MSESLSEFVDAVGHEWHRRGWVGRALLGIFTVVWFAVYLIVAIAIGLTTHYIYLFRGTPKEQRKDPYWPIRAVIAQLRGEQ